MTKIFVVEITNMKLLSSASGPGSRRQRENPAAADGDQKCDKAKGAPQQASRFHGFVTR
jgi:hypothetical protein